MTAAPLLRFVKAETHGRTAGVVTVIRRALRLAVGTVGLMLTKMHSVLNELSLLVKERRIVQLRETRVESEFLLIVQIVKGFR